MNQNNAACSLCNSKNIIKIGSRKNKQQSIQRYRCKDCNKSFTYQNLKNKTYPLHIILKSISYCNLGHSQQQTSNLIAKKHKIKPPQKTISNWINEYKTICTYNKLRTKAKKLHSPETIIEERTFLHNNLPYKFQIHNAKLELLFKERIFNNKFSNLAKFEEPLKLYLEKIPTKNFPHHIFQRKKENQKNLARSSQLKFPTLKFIKIQKQNTANKLTSLALNLAKTNKQRHQAVQNFFLINDSTTIATEIPVYLTKDDITYFLSKGFKLNLINQPTPITGHLDLLQIRNNLIHILDYKPGAHKQNPIHQLTVYALALASKTKLDLKSFKCAWFDENNYYEFFPLHAVYKLRQELYKSNSKI